ncbi:MAG: GldG family protein, partial [Planctomycetota bacterium]
MKTTLRMILAVVLMLVITLSGILIVDKLGAQARVDLTENNVYSLSEGTHEILSKLNQPTTLKLYYSRSAAVEGPEQLREYNNYYHYVRSMLENYVQESGGMLELRVIDPRAFSDQEQNALDAGLKRIPLSGDQSFFFGLVASTELGKQETIPFFRLERRRFLEYDLTKLLSEVISSKQKTVGVLSSLPVMGSQMNPRMAQMMGRQSRQQPWQIVREMRKRYEVKEIQKTAARIDPELDLLMVIHPKKLPKKTLYAIDQYVMRGGKLAVFVDPFCLQDPAANPRSMFQRRRR